jgi:Family of unknown function (DUF6084)
MGHRSIRNGPLGGAPTGIVPSLSFSVEGAERVEHAAVPTIAFALGIASELPVRSVLLDVQLQIAARRRPYDDAAHDRLFELFGPVEQWGTSLRTLLWTRATLVVPPFTGTTVVELPIACSYDLDVTASRYFDALEDGEVPLEFLFSGTVFYGAPLQAARISWESEAGYRMPVALWRETLDRYFNGTAWLRLPKRSLDRLAAHKSRHALATWEDVVDSLLPER